MNIIFVSNYLNHHQISFCENLYKMQGGDFCFIQTEKMTEERINLGWSNNQFSPPYLYEYTQETKEYIKTLFENADIIIYGDTKINFLNFQLKKTVFIWYYRERLFKKGQKQKNNLLRMIKLHYKYSIKNRNYDCGVLCASAYASEDFKRIKAFTGMKFKWGYFPEYIQYNLDEIIQKKEQNIIPRIMWAGRLIDWKRAEDALALAKELKKNGIAFQMEIVGYGDLQVVLNDFIIKEKLETSVCMYGSLTPEQVREHMLQSDIYLVTSDFNEGWGAVVNEAMNSACAVVSSHAVGAAPFLITHGFNGLIYTCGNIDELYQSVKMIIDDDLKRKELQRNAYCTMDEWNAGVAAERLMVLTKGLLRREKNAIYRFEDGICSLAQELPKRWWI